MHWQNLIDGPSALIVVGGTLAATLLRCGFADCGAALGGLRALLARRFDTERTRAELASHIREIRQDGLIRAQPRHLGDAEIDDVTDALIGTRSIAGLQRAHEAHKQRRAEASARAVRTLNQASDLSPVFGLAGTLVSLSQLSSAGGLDQDFRPAIAMAVLTTLYGLLLGNMIFAPLARMIARGAAHEEEARQDLLDWLEAQVADALPGTAEGSVHYAPAQHGRAAR